MEVCVALASIILTIPCAAMSAARVLLPEVPGVQSDRRTSCPPTTVRSISISTASACSALLYSTTPKPRTGLPSSWASWEMGRKTHALNHTIFLKINDSITLFICSDVFFFKKKCILGAGIWTFKNAYILWQAISKLKVNESVKKRKTNTHTLIYDWCCLSFDFLGMRRVTRLGNEFSRSEITQHKFHSKIIGIDYILNPSHRINTMHYCSCVLQAKEYITYWPFFKTKKMYCSVAALPLEKFCLLHS